MKEEFSRTAMLIGEDGVNRLKSAHVAVFGLGGVGSYAAEALARAGVGALTIIDNDTVSLSNINRQLYALHSTAGMLKTDVAAARIADINPECRVVSVPRFYLPENGGDFFSEHYDYIIDAIDTVSAKIDIAVRANAAGIPLISSMGTGNKLHPELFEVADIYDTSVCPLCRVMRRELRARGVPGLRVVYSREAPLSPIPGFCTESAKSNTPASIAFVPACAGLLLAGEVIRSLCAQ
ncbi:MAG: tRNA threonylcarbamoyladenosine dehydratase [Clostridiales bacterium]|nr:tRNA threonylcarbamoyladenosine dehydratase [Clostridiales bacterium]